MVSRALTCLYIRLSLNLFQKGDERKDSSGKTSCCSMINVKHKEDDTGLEIRVDLAGASKESVDLDAGD